MIITQPTTSRHSTAANDRMNPFDAVAIATGAAGGALLRHMAAEFGAKRGRKVRNRCFVSALSSQPLTNL